MKNIPNRWLIAASAILFNVMLGIVYSWSIFTRPLMDTFGWSKTTATLPFTVYIVVFAPLTILAGSLQDRFGPRRVAIVGGAMIGVGFFLASLVETIPSPAWLCFSYGVISGAGCGMGYATTVPVARKWFPDKPGLAVGLVVMGVGLSALLFAPLGRYFIEVGGVGKAFLGIGVILFLFSILFASMLRNPPEGWHPEGWHPSTSGMSRVVLRDCGPRVVLRSPEFWMMWLTYALMSAVGLMVVGHIAAYSEEAGLAPMYAALSASAFALCNALGRPVSGLMYDRMGAARTMLILFIIQGVMMLSFPHLARSMAGIYLAVAIIGFNYGANFTIFPSLTAECFGIKNLGVNYGMVFSAFGLGGTLGPIIGSLVYDATRSYTAAFTTAAFLVLLAVVITLVFLARYRRLKRECGTPVP